MIAIQDRVTTIENKLKQELEPSLIKVVDVSHLHAKHKSAMESTGGHFNVEIIASCFIGKTKLERHRMIYQILDDMFPEDIHALSIKAKTPITT